MSGDRVARGADWYWSGTCDGYWYGTCADDPRVQCDPKPLYRTYNNWGDQVCGPNPPFPGAGESVYLVGDHIAADGSVLVGYLSLDPGSTLGIGANRSFTIGDALLSNEGTVTVNYQPVALPTSLQFNVDASLSGAGEVVLNAISGNPHAQLNTGEGFTVTQAAGHTIRGTGQINASITNNGLIHADNTVGTDLELTADAKTNNATMKASGGGVLIIGDTTVSQGPAGEIVADAGTVRLDNGATIVGGTMSTANGGIVTTSYLATTTLTDAHNIGRFDINPRSTTRLTGSTLTNDGTINVNSPTAWVDPTRRRYLRCRAILRQLAGYGTKSKRRVVPLTPRVRRPLEVQFVTQPRMGMKRRTAQRMVQRVAGRARITQHVTPHVLRHTFAVNCARAGVSTASLKKLLGHDRLETTDTL